MLSLSFANSNNTPPKCLIPHPRFESRVKRTLAHCEQLQVICQERYDSWGLLATAVSSQLTLKCQAIIYGGMDLLTPLQTLSFLICH